MSKWKDVTSYSRSEPNRTPRSWQWQDDNITLSVHRLHEGGGKYTELWFLSCRELNMNNRPLDPMLGESLERAVGIVSGKLMSMAESLGKVSTNSP